MQRPAFTREGLFPLPPSLSIAPNRIKETPQLNKTLTFAREGKRTGRPFNVDKCKTSPTGKDYFPVVVLNIRFR